MSCVDETIRSSMQNLKKDALSKDNKEITFNLVHSWRNEMPRCIFVMEYNKTMPASSVGWKEWNGTVCFQEIGSLLGDVSIIPSHYQNLATSFRRAVEWYKTVVPFPLVQKWCKSLQSHAALLQSADEMCDTNSNLSNLRQIIKQCKTECSQLVLKVEEDVTSCKVEVNKEIQRNDFCYDLLKGLFLEHRYILKNSTENNNVCLFGNSHLDMYFYKMNTLTVNAALIKHMIEGDEVVTDDRYGVVGAVAEFKANAAKFNSHYPQMFADMVQVASIRTIQALKTGKIIDKVEIYGLLVDQKSSCALAMKYYINFPRDESVFYVCEEENPCEELLIGILRKLDCMK